ncbi:GGDEF domain-containing protein [Planococcus sp. YIM B11945]|uniref:GGDEF domain-containing protein n=1 Tax=Planococcus sp. YIM B11945 TaxID=3435410 RepID=UPI003D7CC74E
MEEQLNLAPCGYLVMDPSYQIVEMNRTLGELLGAAIPPGHMHELLTVASRAYFQTYFMPSMKTYGRVDEMHLILKSADGRIPVLMNASERNGQYECVLLPMAVRQQYENELLLAKRQAEKIHQESIEAFNNLQTLMREVEGKKREVEELNELLQVLTVTDPLTGLKNRRYLDSKLSECIEAARKTALPLSILGVDIDHFKRINDTYGHAAGDTVLQELAWKLETEINEPNFVVRLGGEEFLIVLPGSGKEETWQMAEKLRQNIARGPWKHVEVTISIGAALFEAGDDAASLMEKADKALYKSKIGGRNLVSASWA